MITSADIGGVADAARHLAPPAQTYHEEDYVMNLLATVVDFQTHTTAVVKALESFKAQRWDEVRTIEDLEALFRRYTEDKQGNTALAQYLWGYNMWTRAQHLRDLVRYFRSIGVTDQERLRAWATRSTFKRDFEGRVKGLGPAVYQWLIMRLGVDTVKPDVHVRRFAETVLGRRLNDQDLIDVVVGAARVLGIPAYELDWRIWEASRAGALQPLGVPKP
ncbi:MAG: hypothetical protein ACJ789_09590 [Thermomicrobiales bacterium]